MTSYGRTITVAVSVVGVLAALLAFGIVPGCTQMQDNSPISIRNVSDLPSLSVTCSDDGSVAYVTDGRNVYRYAATAGDPSWQCILSNGQRLRLAHQYDPCEPSP